MKYLPPIQKNFNDVCGIPLDGGKIEVYLHGTTTPASLYSDADGTAFAPNPYKVNVLGDVKFFVDADTELDYFVYDDIGYLRASYSKVKVNPCENGGGSGPSVDVEWDDVKNKPSAFPPSQHRHEADDIDNLPEVPTKTSQLENDSGFITSEAIPAVPTKTSELVNDSGFISDISQTVDITDKIGTVSQGASVSIVYNETIGMLSVLTLYNPGRTVSGSEYVNLFKFNEDFPSFVNLGKQTEIRVRNNNYDSYFTVMYFDSVAQTVYTNNGIYIGPVQKSWNVSPGNTKYFFLTSEENLQLKQYLSQH